MPVNEDSVIDWGRVMHFWHRMENSDAPLKPFECDVSQCLFCAHLHDRLAGERADGHMREGEPACEAHITPWCRVQSNLLYVTVYSNHPNANPHHS